MQKARLPSPCRRLVQPRGALQLIQFIGNEAAVRTGIKSQHA